MKKNKENKTIETIIEMYCKKHHHTDSLCQECTTLLEYCKNKIEKCPYKSNEKPFCSLCPIHCYDEEMRSRIILVMKDNRKRMLFTHPILSFQHLYQMIKNKKKKKKNFLTPLKLMFVFLSLITFVLGTIGIFLPILPTVPLYMLTTFFLSKGSKKFHVLFTSSKLYQKHVACFVEHHSMTLLGMLSLLLFVSAMLIFAIYKVDILPMTIIIWILMIVKYSYFITKINVVSKSKLLEIRTEYRND